MTYKLAFTKSFGRELKKLKKKYPTILADLDRLAVELLKIQRLVILFIKIVTK
jgi:mRNA-degrading endonuclease RelE of RelBE toxin-antitoxin system